MIPRIIMYSTICLAIIGMALWAATYNADQRTQTQTVLTRVVPTMIDQQPVYPTNHAVIALDPTQEYRWNTIELPDTWPLNEYYVELWGNDNRPITGFGATKLISHELDISSIDATLNPALRVVIFQPSSVTALPTDAAVYISYSEYPNVRLFILLAAAALLYWTVLVWLTSRWRELKQFPQQVMALLHGNAIPALWATLATVLGAGVFGIVLGWFIGGIQIFYVLIKLPFLMGCALVISFTSLAGLSSLLGVKKTTKELWVIALNLLALTALGLASFTTLLGFYIIYPLDHDTLLIATVSFFTVSGLLALTRLYRWVRNPILPLVWLAVYGVVFLQLGWLLRPWVGVIDPVQDSVPFARANSGNVLTELIHTVERLEGP